MVIGPKSRRCKAQDVAVTDIAYETGRPAQETADVAPRRRTSPFPVRLFRRYGHRTRRILLRIALGEHLGIARQHEQKTCDHCVGEGDRWRYGEANGLPMHEAEESERRRGGGEDGRFGETPLDDKDADGAEHEPRDDGAASHHFEAAI